MEAQKKKRDKPVEISMVEGVLSYEWNEKNLNFHAQRLNAFLRIHLYMGSSG